MRPQQQILGVLSKYLTKYETPKYIVWLARCKILSNIAGMENFTIEHTNLGTNFFGKISQQTCLIWLKILQNT